MHAVEFDARGFEIRQEVHDEVADVNDVNHEQYSHCPRYMTRGVAGLYLKREFLVVSIVNLKRDLSE